MKRELGEQQVTLVLMPVEDKKHTTGSFRTRKHYRLFTRLFAVFAIFGVLFITGGVGATASSPASAIDIINTCTAGGLQGYEYEGRAIEAWPGMSSMMVGGTGAVLSGAGTAGLNSLTDPYGTGLLGEYAPDRVTTAYEWWGTAGMQWKMHNYAGLPEPPIDCGWGGLGWQAVYTIASLLWQFVLTAGGLIIFLYTLATTPEVMLNTLLEKGGAIDTILQGTFDSLYLPFLIPMIIVAALWAAWVGLVKKRASETVQGVIWVICAAAFSVAFLTNPVWFTDKINYGIAVVQNTLYTALASPAYITGTGSSSTSSTSGASSSAAGPGPAVQMGDKELCYAGSGGPGAVETLSNVPTTGKDIDYNVDSVKFATTGVTRQFQCQLWEIFILTPYIQGQYGDLAGRQLTKDPDGGAKVAPVTINGREVNNANSWALLELDANIANHNEVISGKFDVNTKQPTRTALINYIEKNVDNVKISSGLRSWIGAEAGSQIGTSILAFVAVLAGGIPVVILSLKMLFYQFMMIFMFLLAPIFFIIGIHPGFGRRVALGWLEYIINLALKRVGIVALLAVLLTMIRVVLTANMPWIFQVFVVSMSSIAMLMFSGKLLDMIAQVNLNGNSIDDIEGGVKQKMSQGAGLAVGAVAGGVGAASVGGSVLKGAATGGLTGTKAGPLQAGIIGAATGKATGPNEDAQKRKEEKKAAKEHEKKMNDDPVYKANYEAQQREAERQRELELQAEEDQAIMNADVSQADSWADWSKKSGRSVPVPADPALEKNLRDRGVPMRARQDQIDAAIAENEEFDKKREADNTPPVCPSCGQTMHLTSSDMSTAAAFCVNKDCPSRGGTNEPGVVGVTPSGIIIVTKRKSGKQGLNAFTVEPNNADASTTTQVIVEEQQAGTVVNPTVTAGGGNNSGGGNNGGSGNNSGGGNNGGSDAASEAALGAALAAAAQSSVAAAEARNASGKVEDLTKETSRRPTRPNLGNNNEDNS